MSSSDQNSPLRHPIHAAEHEVEHLHDVADKGESAVTPAIVAGGVIAFLVPIVAVVMTLALGAYYLFRDSGTSAPGAGQGVEHPGATPQTSAAGNAVAGKAVFTANCSTCHGATGRGGNGGPDLTRIPSAKNPRRVIAQVTNGGGGMPSFKGSLSDQQIRDVAAYVTTRITNRN